MKITKQEAIELQMLEDIIELKKYNYHQFMANSEDDTEIELTVDQFRYIVSAADIFDSDTRDHY